MSDDNEYDDRMAEQREWACYMHELDREIAAARDRGVQAERERARVARERWGNLPAVRLRPGVPTHRLSEDEAALLDREGW